MAVLEINTNPTRRDLRWFGLLLPLFVAIVGTVVWRRTDSLTPATVVWGAGALLSAVFAIWPASRPRIYVGWMYAVFPIGWALSHLLLGVIYFLVITPIGIALRILRGDPLDRDFKRDAPSYWSAHTPPERVERYLRQF
ncbi:MAG: SxtJ family membrane protein [Pirellulaceae bacterium]